MVCEGGTLCAFFLYWARYISNHNLFVFLSTSSFFNVCMWLTELFDLELVLNKGSAIVAQPAVCNTTKHGRNGIRAMPKNFVTCNSFCVYIFTYIVHNSLLLLKQFEKKKKTVFLLENTIQDFAPVNSTFSSLFSYRYDASTDSKSSWKGVDVLSAFYV